MARRVVFSNLTFWAVYDQKVAQNSEVPGLERPERCPLASMVQNSPSRRAVPRGQDSLIYNERGLKYNGAIWDGGTG